ncbi:MAG TPA: hypothetical protein VF970_06495 [Gemmatimonadales bacterium]
MEFFAPMVVVTTLILTVGSTIVLRGPLGRALADRLAARRAGGSDQDGAVEELRQEVEDLRGTLSEVQERLDFAERLLLQRREAEPLPEKGGGNAR